MLGGTGFPFGGLQQQQQQQQVIGGGSSMPTMTRGLGLDTNPFLQQQQQQQQQQQLQQQQQQQLQQQSMGGLGMSRTGYGSGAPQDNNIIGGGLGLNGQGQGLGANGNGLYRDASDLLASLQQQYGSNNAGNPGNLQQQQQQQQQQQRFPGMPGLGQGLGQENPFQVLHNNEVDFPALPGQGLAQLQQQPQQPQQSGGGILSNNPPSSSSGSNQVVGGGSGSGTQLLQLLQQQQHQQQQQQLHIQSLPTGGPIAMAPVGGGTAAGSGGSGSDNNAAAVLGQLLGVGQQGQGPFLQGGGIGIGGNIGIGGGIGGGSISAGAGGGGGLSKEGKFGLAGLLDVIRMTDKDLNMLALGSDLTTFGLNLNAADSLYASFTSPFSDQPTATEPQFTTPSCYVMTNQPAIKADHLTKFQLETLFFIFYSMPRDLLQACAAQELYRREWRYHGELRLWLKVRSQQELMQGQPNIQFVYFDVNGWVARPFTTAYRGNLAAGLLSDEEIRVKAPPVQGAS